MTGPKTHKIIYKFINNFYSSNFYYKKLTSHKFIVYVWLNKLVLLLILTDEPSLILVIMREKKRNIWFGRNKVTDRWEK